MDKNIAHDKFFELRCKAERLLVLRGNVSSLADGDDLLKLTNELQTYQIELELQNKELHRSQQELMQVQKNYTELYDFSPVGYITTSLKGLILRTNRIFSDMLLTERAFLMNHRLSEFIHIEDQDIYYKHLNNLSESGTRQVSELRLQPKDGAVLDVQLESTVVLNKAEDPEEYRTVVIDSSKRKRIQKKFNDEIKLRTALIEALPYPTMLIKKDRTIILANKAARDAGAKIGGICWRDFGHTEHISAKDKDYINQHKTTNGLFSHCIFCLADEALADSKLCIAPEVESFGKVFETYWMPLSNDLFLHYAFDITEQKKLEKEKESYRKNLENQVAQRTYDLSVANEGLIQANRLKDEFLANMSHELRTPLTAILGMSEALLEHAYGPLNEPQEKSLRTVEKSGEHLLSLVNDILDLSKINAGKIELAQDLIYIKDVCQASLQMINQAALKKNQTVSLDIDSQTEYVKADMTRLKQILVNLLSNAVKFTPENGKIGLEVSCNPGNDRIEFTVSDTGVGIATADMGKLFKPFVQLDGTYTRSHDGTGLGLSLVQKLTDLHNGSVTVDSEKGEFTRVTVALPSDSKSDPTPEN